MKKLLILALVVAAVLAGRDEAEYRRAFADWTATHSKRYASTEEQETRYANFKATLDDVDAWNSNPDKSYTRGLNMFSDLTPTEFVSIFARGNRVNASELFQKREAPSMNVVEERSQDKRQFASCFDYSKRSTSTSNTYTGSSNVVTSVEAQGPAPPSSSCNTCWSFAAVGSIESCYAIQTGNAAVSLSKQQLVDWSTATGYYMSCFRNSRYCDGGGWPQNLFYTLLNEQSPKGAVATSSAYPYAWTSSSSGHFTNTQSSIVSSSRSLSYTVPATVTSYVSGNTKTGLKSELLNGGPVSVCFAVPSSMQSYSSGVWSPSAGECTDTFNADPTNIHHCALAVGWATDAVKGLYYIVKNQFGSGWAEAGYMRIAEGTATLGNCGIAGYYSRAVCAPLLINYDCTGGGIYTTSKQGLAATGFKSTDRWNTITQNWPSATYYSSPIVYANGETASGVSVSINTFSGSYWDNPNPTNQDPMYWRFIYTDNSNYMTVTVSGLPGASYWSVYLYGKAHDASYCGDHNTAFTVQVKNSGGTVVSTQGPTGVTGNLSPWDSSNLQPNSGWEAGTHYVVFNNVYVSSGDSLFITATAGGGVAGCYYKPTINGFQLLGRV